MIIKRPLETGRIGELRKWTLVYGRRKTGKTFLVRNFLRPDEYFFVKNNRSLLSKDNTALSYETFIELLKRALGEGKTVVVDEFHRLGGDFFDFLHAAKKQGRLILISSTLFLSKKLISGKSALLGLLAEVPVGLIRLEDCIRALGQQHTTKERLELALLLREPLAAEYIGGKSARETIAQVLLSSLRTVPALLGEIFIEEERELSGIYEGVVRAVATGKVTSGEISSALFSRNVIAKDDPSFIQPYLLNLVSFGILRRIPVLNKKRFVYKLSSPLLRIYYYADEKYNLSERQVTEKELLPILEELLPRLVEDGVREALAEKLGLREAVIEAGDFDIDGCLLRFKKPEVVLEVKWKKLDRGEILAIEQKLGIIDAPKHVLFVPDKKMVSAGVTVMDVGDLA